MSDLYLLFESASGYALFKKKEFDETGGKLPKIQKAIDDLERFSKMVVLEQYKPFTTAEEALDNIMAITQNKVTNTLKTFLTTHLPATKSSKKQKFLLGIFDPKMGQEIFNETGFTASFNESISELHRGVRTHFDKLMKVESEDITKAQLGLGHSFSRTKCATDVNRQDKPIIQTIALIEQLDKNINTFCMRLKEWFSWTFPELTKIVNDNTIFTKLVNFIEKRENITDEMKEQLNDIVLDDEKAQQIIDAAKVSMGQEMSEVDCHQIKRFSERCVELIDFRESLTEYLKQRMNAVAPNLAALIGDIVGSKLISHAGGLTNLSKYPASTIQILGAEKALFRALKTKGKTPKYGLIFNSTFIGRANQKNKGRISRYLANKCAIASRVDCFSESPTSKFGESLKDQMEERLKFLSSGTKPRKNKEVMNEVIEELKKEGLFFGDKVRVPKGEGDADAESDDEGDAKEKKRDKKKKEKAKKADSDSDDEEAEEEPKKDKKDKDSKKKKDKKDKKDKEDKKDKKDKKRSHKEVASDDEDDAEVAKPEKKKKKKSKD